MEWYLNRETIEFMIEIDNQTMNEVITMICETSNVSFTEKDLV